jgi:hypothetical protein
MNNNSYTKYLYQRNLLEMFISLIYVIYGYIIYYSFFFIFMLIKHIHEPYLYYKMRLTFNGKCCILCTILQ